MKSLCENKWFKTHLRQAGFEQGVGLVLQDAKGDGAYHRLRVENLLVFRGYLQSGFDFLLAGMLCGVLEGFVLQVPVPPDGLDGGFLPDLLGGEVPAQGRQHCTHSWGGEKKRI